MNDNRHFTMRRMSFTLLLILALVRASAAQADGNAVYLSDLGKCEPKAALSDRMEPGTWRLLTYKTPEVSGVMVKAASVIDAPELTLPLGLTGWHAVYIGYWNPTPDYDGDHLIKVKLSGESAFRRIEEKQSTDTQTRTFLRECFVRCADLTGKDLVIGKCSGSGGRKASLAYVKAVPLSEQQVAAIRRDQSRRDTKKLQVSLDGSAFAWTGEFSKPSDLLDLVEPYRDSDVERVHWAMCYGDQTIYPTRVDGAVYLAAKDVSRTGLCDVPAHDYVRNEKNWADATRAMTDSGVIPAKVIAEHLHSMGIQCDLTFRLGIIAGLFYNRDEGFVAEHPECRQVDREGNAVGKASYAFPRVQQLMLDIIRESMESVDADGASLCFTRGPRFLLYEKPVLESFQREYGEDARGVSPSDPRLLRTRAKIMSQFVRQCRSVLDEIGRKRGRKLRLSVWVWPHDQNTWCGLTPMDDGLDIETWVKEKWVDSVICKQAIDHEYLAACQTHGCEYVACNEVEVWRNPQDVVKAYDAGIEKLLWWDADSMPLNPTRWEWFRRVGHADEMRSWDASAHEPRSIVLTEVEGINVCDSFLQQAVYSGG
jgi:hypothetical protein